MGTGLGHDTSVRGANLEQKPITSMTGYAIKIIVPEEEEQKIGEDGERL